MTTEYEPKDLNGLIRLFGIDDKQELKRYCKNLVVYSEDFYALILGGRAGAIEPYLYACHFNQQAPEHLVPSEEEKIAFSRRPVGSLEGKAKKLVVKLFQSLKDRRIFAAHLFYAPSKKYWQLFYFDQRDVQEAKNHWEHGVHIHYINDMLVNQSLPEVWAKVLSEDTHFSSSIHLRYEGNRA